MPVLGICYGMQTMAAQLGGCGCFGQARIHGYTRCAPTRGHRLLRDIEDHTSAEGWGLLDVWMSHGDRVEELPPGFIAICTTDNAPLAGMADEVAQPVRPAVSSGGDHTSGRAHPRSVSVRDLRLRGAVECQQHHRRQHTPMRNRSVGRSCSACRAAWIPQWSPRCCTVRAAWCIFVDNGLLRLHEGDP